MLNKHVPQPVCLTVGFARRNLKFTLFSCWLIVLLPTGKNLLRTASVNILHLLQIYENEIKIRWQMFQRWGLLILRWHTARPFWDIFLWFQFSIIVTDVISSSLTRMCLFTVAASSYSLARVHDLTTNLRLRNFYCTATIQLFLSIPMQCSGFSNHFCVSNKALIRGTDTDRQNPTCTWFFLD